MAITSESRSEIKLLLRSLKPEIFRLIIVQHNHSQVIDQVVEQIKQIYPKRSVKRLQLEHKNYRELTEAIYQQGTGVLVIEDFHKILDKPEVYVAFNQRRDKFAQFPLALICCIPIGDKVLQECMRKLPDFWSFRNLVVKLEQAKAPEYSIPQESNKESSTIGGDTIYEKEKELNSLIVRIDELQPNSENIPLINSYYPQILQLFEETGNYQRGLEYAVRFVNLAEEYHYSQNLPSIYSDALNWQAKFFQYLGQYDEARKLLEKALKSDILNYGDEHPAVARSQSNLATVYRDLGQYENARNLLEKALQSDIQNFGDEHPEVARSQSNLATVYRDLGQYENARDLLEKALQSDIQNFGDKHPEVARSQSNLATVYRDLGQYENARDLLEKALQSDIQNFGDKHPSVAVKQSNLALVYQDLGQYENARDLLEKALQSDIQNFGDKHPAVARSQSNLATVYQDLGQYENARDLLEKALQSNIQNYGDKHPAVARSQSNLATVYQDLGQYENARDLLEKALQSDILKYEDQHPIVAVRQSNLALVYQDLGQYEKAKGLWQQAYATFLHTLGEHHPNTQTVKTFLEQLEGK